MDGNAVGSLTDPIILHVCTSQNIDLAQGWNWVSFNVIPADQSVDTLLRNYTPQDDDIIKGSKGSAIYNQGKWYTSSDSFKIEAGRMYKITSDSDITLVALGVHPAKVSLDLIKGWNWVGYSSQDEVTLEEWLGLLTTVANGDRLISSPLDGVTATYSAGTWYANKEAIFKPGMGYLLYISNPQTIKY